MEKAEVGKTVRVLFKNIGCGVVKESKVLAIKPGNALGSVLIKTIDGQFMSAVNPLSNNLSADFVTDTVCSLGNANYNETNAIKVLGFKGVKIK